MNTWIQEENDVLNSLVLSIYLKGGELCLSETKHGVSVIRYWPKFLSEKGNDLMLNR